MKVISPTNIAIVKYWGKNPYFEYYNIPTKSSLSITVDKLYTETEVSIESGEGKIELVLNEERITKERKEFDYIEKFFEKFFSLDKGFKEYNYKIKTKNNFPTAAGFASSASGFSALAKSIALSFERMDSSLFSYLNNDKKLSSIARLGSGSASRSVPEKGGFVIWRRGFENPKEISDVYFSSYAESLFDYSHWKNLNIVYLILSEKEKKVKSRKGMKITVETNPLYWKWVEYEEKKVIPELIDSVKEKNFEKFGEIAMRCSDSLHAMMRYSYPPIIYTNDESHRIMEKIIEFNERGVKASYTFDAGSNAILFVEDENVEELLSFLKIKNYIIAKPGKGSSKY